MDQPETPEGPGWRGQPWHGATRPGQELGLRAGNRAGLGDCPSKGRCLSRITGVETQADTLSRSHPAMSGPGGQNPGGGRMGLPRPHTPLPHRESSRDTCRARQRDSHGLEHRALLQSAPMSIANLRQGWKPGSAPLPKSKSLRERGQNALAIPAHDSVCSFTELACFEVLKTTRKGLTHMRTNTQPTNPRLLLPNWGYPHTLTVYEHDATLLLSESRTLLTQ